MTQQKVNNFNLGLFLKTKIIVACGLTLIMLLPFCTYGASRCTNPVTDADAQKMCQSLISAVEAEKPIEEVTEQLVQFVLNKVDIGDKGTFGENDGCYEVSRIQIDLFCETEEKLILDKLIDIGEKKNQPVILAAVCQTRKRDDFKDIYATVSVHVFLKKIDSSIVLSADTYTLSPGESTDIKATLKCKECTLKDKTVRFTSSGPGQISPEQPRTEADGVATTKFTADKSGKTVVAAHYENQKASIKLNIIASWDLICTFYCDHLHHPTPHVTKWRSEVKFENIPLGKCTGISYPPDSPESMKRLQDCFKVSEKEFKSKGTLTDEYFVSVNVISGISYRGYSEGQPVWILLIGAGYKDETQKTGKTDIVTLYFSIELGSLMHHCPPCGSLDSYPLTYLLLGRYNPLKIPEEKLNEVKPFSIEFEESWYGGHIRFIPRDR